MSKERPPVLIAGGLPDAGLPAIGARPALVMQAQALAREQGALAIAWPRWDMAVITPAAPPLGLVAGGLGLLLPPDELVVAPDQAAPVATALAALLVRPSAAASEAAAIALAPIATPEAALWRVVIAGWAAALSREWEQLDQAIRQTYHLLDRPALPQAARAGALLALAILELEAGEAAGQAEIWINQALPLFAQLGLEAQAGLVCWVRAQALERQGRLAEAEAQADAALAAIEPVLAPVVAALIQAGVAGLHLSRAQSAEQRQSAIEQLAEAARRCPADTAPLLAARLLASLGDAYQSLGDDQGALREALACYQRAAELFRATGTSEDLAAVQMSEGSVWQGLDGDTRANSLKAIDCYHQSLRVFTLATHPAEYALIHSNLATAYLKMPMNGERDIMRQALAVQSMQEALKVYTIEEHPREYAMVQNNLGNVLQYLPSGDRVEKLDRAIEAYHEALRVRTRQRLPVEYAVTMSNLANAYANVPAEERRQMLSLAERCYGEALEVFQAFQRAEQAQTVEQALALVRRDLERHAALEAAYQ